MLTKNAMGNIINRYNAVLSKCRLLNVFGTLALAGTVILGGIGAGDACAYTIPTPQKDAYSVFEKDENTKYYTTFTVDGKSYGIKLNKSIVHSGLSEDEAFTTTADYGAIAELVGAYSREGYTIAAVNNEEDSTFALSFNWVPYYFKVSTPSGSTSNVLDSVQAKNGDSYIYLGSAAPLIIGSETTSASIESSDFIGNISSTGGAINNTGTNITIYNTNFIGNTSTNNGGAIYNSGSITSIDADFIGNVSSLQGAAIYNNSGKTIGSITGDFIGNKAGGSGGAIYNSGTITTLTSDFIGNNASGDGGAIFNTQGEITTIKGDFINNTTDKKGGAICNIVTDTATSTIGTISGDFIGNKATGTSGYGGAIYNASTITTISGDFANNTANKNGGAIYNIGTITTVSGDFIGNKASAKGGAIYTASSITFLAANETHTFTNNVVGSDYNAIYVDSGSATLSFKMTDSGSFTMNDSITGFGSYGVAITGASAANNIFKLNDEINTMGTVTVAGATLELGTSVHEGGSIANTTTVGSVSGSLVIGASGGTTGDDAKTAKLLVNITDTSKTAIINELTVNEGSTAEVKAGTLKLTGTSTLNGTMTASSGTTVILDGRLFIGRTSPSNEAPTVTLAGFKISDNSIVDIDKGKVVLTKDFTLNGTLYMGQGTGIEADGAHVAIHEGPNAQDAYLFAKGSDSAITVEHVGGGIAHFNAYADEGGKLIFGALPTEGESKVQYDYIASQMGDDFDAKDMLYVGLGESLTMANGASLVVGGAPSVTANATPNADGANFGTNSLFIANVAGLDTGLGADAAVIDGGGNVLTVDANSALGLVNASEGEYTILHNFGTVTNADTNNEGNTVPWNEESVTIGNCLLVVDTVTGSGTNADPYKVKVRQDVNENLYDTDGGGALEDVMNSGEYGPNSTNALAQYLYQAGEKGDVILDKAKTNTASAGANARSGATGMAATRTAAATMSMRNITMHRGSAHKLKAAGGTLLIKDANGNVKAEYDDVIQVADNGSTSDVPMALGGTGSGLGNSIGLWAMPFYGHESISDAQVGSHSNDTRTDMYGMTMGVDKTFTPSGIDVCRAGIAFNVGTGETEGSGYTGSSESDFDFFGLAAYGSMRKGAAMLSASVSYTNTDDEFNSEGIQGTTDTDVWYGTLNGEYVFDMGELEDSVFFSNFNIVPYTGIGFMTSHVDEYTTSLGSSVETDRQNVFTFPVGLKFNKEFTLDSGWILKPEIAAGVIFAEGDLYQRTVTGNSLGSNLDTIKSQVMDKTTMDLGFSLDMRKDKFGVLLDYSLEKSDTRTAHGVSAKIEYQF